MLQLRMVTFTYSTISSLKVSRQPHGSRSSSHNFGCLVGGDVNIIDEDGDTPLYVVENVETARYLVEHGAVVNHRDNEGVTVCH